MANQADQIQQAVCATIRDEVEGLRNFVDRRVAELSTEVHATVQLMTFSEANLSGQLGDIQRQVAAAIPAVQDVAPPGSEREWEATVRAAEAAAERVVEAAGTIGNWLREVENDPAAPATVGEKAKAAFGADAFRGDIAQRIRRAIRHLQQVEFILAQVAPGEAGQPSDDAARGLRSVHKPAPVQGGASRAPSGPAAARTGFGSRLAMQAVDDHPAEPVARFVPVR